MLRFMILPLFFFSFSALEVGATCFHQKHACSMQLQENLIQDSLQAAEAMKQDKQFQSFLIESNQQRDAALEDKNFQEFVANLQTQALPQGAPFKHQQRNENQPGEPSGQMPSEGILYVFVSFSMGEKALLNLAQEAKAYGVTLILRGFKDNSYAKTVQSLQHVIQKTGQGFLIDPELFTLFGITAVPTYVLARPFNLPAQERSQTPLHDRIQGHVSIRYALEVFAKERDLQEEANSLLAKLSSEKREPQ